MGQIVWTKLASEQFERAIKYIRNEQRSYYAKIVLNKVINTVSLLETFPAIGPIEPLLKHKKSEYRYIVVFSYKIIYRSLSGNIIISRFFHTYQKPTKLFKK